MENSEICRIKFVPNGSDEAPRFNFDSGEMMISEDDFISYKDAHEKTTELLNHWKENRESVEAKLHSIAGELDLWEQNTNITNVVGGSVGTVGGVLTAIGLIVAAPVALAGLVIGGAASVTTLVADKLKEDNIKKNLQTAKELIEKDSKLTEELTNSIAKLDEKKYSILSKNDASMVENTMTSGVKSAISSAGKEPLSLRLKESIPQWSALAGGATSSAAAVAIVGHIITLASSAEGLARGSRSESARMLREAAEKLKDGREATMGDFPADYPI